MEPYHDPLWTRIVRALKAARKAFRKLDGSWRVWYGPPGPITPEQQEMSDDAQANRIRRVEVHSSKPQS